MTAKELTKEKLEILNSKLGLYALLRNKKVNVASALEEATYEAELKKLQEELIKLQNWVINSDKKVVVLFEGRDRKPSGREHYLQPTGCEVSKNFYLNS